MLSTALAVNIIKRCGFVEAGVSEPGLNKESQEKFRELIDKKNYAEMAWLARNVESRLDIKSRLPWVKSVLVAADSYYCERNRPVNYPKISRYAWGEDYHEVVKSKLKLAVEQLRKFDPAVKAKINVDTGPLLEKVYAVQAGLGWMGKNTTVIIDGYGSFCFLGIILLNIRLEPGLPIQNRCGDCDLCQKACPANSLEKAYVLDAMKCNAYVTIENKKAISEEERGNLNNWLYGCDACQDVCPWNQKWAKTSEEQKYYNKVSQLERSKEEWERLSTPDFQDLARKSVFERLKYERFRRNLSALGKPGK